MAIIGGMDAGYGSQTKLIRTNFLCAKMAGDSSSQALSNMLTLVNRRLPTNMQCDYVVTEFAQNINVPTGNANGSTEHSVIATYGRRGNMSLMGPSSDSLANRAGIGAHAGEGGSFGFVHKKTAGVVHMVTSVNACRITAHAAGDNFDTFSSVVLNPPTTNDAHIVEDINSKLLDTMMEGFHGTGSLTSTMINLTAPLEDIDGLLSTVDYTDAALTTNFIPEGNTAGLSPTTFTSLGAIIDNKVFAILSVTALIQTAQ